MIYYFMHNGLKIVRKAAYDDITHFIADNKCVVAYTHDSELVLDETLKEIAGNHPELIYTHRSTLVRSDSIALINRSNGNRKYAAVMTCGIELKVSRREYPKIRALVDGRRTEA